MAFIDNIENVEVKKKTELTVEQINGQIETAVRKYIEILIKISEKKIKEGQFEQRKPLFSKKTINKLVVRDYSLPPVEWYLKRTQPPYLSVYCDWEGGSDWSPYIRIVSETSQYYRFFLQRLSELARKEGFQVVTYKHNFSYN